MTRSQMYYLSRIVVAESNGVRVAFGPVDTCVALQELFARLRSSGWTVIAHMKLCADGS